MPHARRLFLCFAFIVFASQALAEERIIPKIASPESGNNKVAKVSYFSEGCEEAECMVAFLECDGERGLSVTANDIPTSKAVAIMERERQGMQLIVDGSVYQLSVDGLKFFEMGNSWMIKGYLHSSEAHRSLAKVESMTLLVADEVVQLPITKEVQQWARKCSK